MLRAVLLTLALIVGATPVSLAANDTTVLVLNTGDEPIFKLRVGNADHDTWSDDLLMFNDVIDVSRGRDVTVPVDPTLCAYDVQAIYRDGDTITLRDVDLCRVHQLTFAH